MNAEKKNIKCKIYALNKTHLKLTYVFFPCRLIRKEIHRKFLLIKMFDN